MNGVNARGIRTPGARVGRVNEGGKSGRNSEPRNTGDGGE